MTPDYKAIIDLVGGEFGFNFAEYREETLIRRIDKRIGLSECRDAAGYLTLLKGDPEERGLLYRDFFIHFTGFFRDREAFDALSKLVLPDIIDRPDSPGARFWVAGCATGEEAWSLAITVAEYVRVHRPGFPWRIFATDIDPLVIRRASTGEYTDEEVKDIPVGLLTRWFTRTGSAGWKVAKELREKILFACHNVVQEPPYIRLDLISCRNLFIYLKPETQQKLFSIFHFAIREGGAIILGQSEHLPASKGDFQTLSRKWRIYRCTSKNRWQGGLQVSLRRDRMSLAEPIQEGASGVAVWGKEQKENYLQMIAGEYAPACVIVNRENQIVFTHGDITPYLHFPSGVFKPELFQLLKNPLADLVRDALGQGDSPVIYENILFQDRKINITVKPVEEEKNTECYRLIDFSPNTSGRKGHVIREVDSSEISRRRIAALEEELEQSREKLQNTIEELQSTNEELLSSNEELQSTNEELQTVNRELQDSEERFRRIVQDQTEFIVRFNNDFRIQFANDSFSRHTGLSTDRLGGTRITDLLPDDKQEELSLRIRNLTIDAPVISEEITITRSDNSECHEQWSFRALFAENGTLKGYQGVGRDLTERINMENALREGEARYRALFNSMQNGFALHEIITDRDGNPVDYRYLEANPAFGELTGIPIDNIKGKRIKELVPDIENDWIEAFGKVALTGISVTFENQAAPLGRYYHVYAFSPKPRQFAVIFSDISERIKAEETMNAARVKAEEADRLKSQFLANMSHEIRTPMNAILGFSELMELPETNTDQIREYSSLIRANGEHLLNLLNDILDLSKIEANQIQLTETINPLKALMEEVFATLHITISPSVELRLNYGLGGEKNILMDKNRVRQVLINLLTNARKFTAEGIIELGCRQEDPKTLLFYVKDTGIGIPKEGQQRIFDRFFQATSGNQGTGLGLNISRGLVNLMGGRLWFESVEGKGSTFYFTLPYRAVTEKRKEKQTLPATDSGEMSLTILCAEDNDVNFYLIESYLRRADTKLIRVVTGDDAVNKIRTDSSIDMILMDIKMPGMDGLEATLQIRALGWDKPVIAVTAYASDEDKRAAFGSGCSDYLAKPFKKEDLVRMIQSHLERRKNGK
jgi:two-component system CheB/CheR fusion protein